MRLSLNFDSIFFLCRCWDSREKFELFMVETNALRMRKQKKHINETFSLFEFNALQLQKGKSDYKMEWIVQLRQFNHCIFFPFSFWSSSCWTHISNASIFNGRSRQKACFRILCLNIFRQSSFWDYSPNVAVAITLKKKQNSGNQPTLESFRESEQV